MEVSETNITGGKREEACTCMGCTSENKLLEDISLYFYFQPEVFENMLEKKKDGFLKGMINEVVDIFVKKDLVLEHEKIQQNI